MTTLFALVVNSRAVLGGKQSNRCGAKKTLRTCARIGCSNSVKKPTAKYCSRNCCAIDPERHNRLRVQARRNNRNTILSMSRQLSFEWSVTGEGVLASLCQGREDVPAGLARLVG